MTAVHEALYTRLTTGLAATIGTRCYPGALPQETTLPAVTYTAVGGEREYAHDGDQNLFQARFQVSAWGATYQEARELADAVIQALNAWTPAAFCAAPLDIPQPGVPLHQCAVDVVLWHKD